MTSFDAYRILNWLAENSFTQQHLPPELFPRDEALGLYEELVQDGLIEETLSLGGSFSFVPTAAGRVAARQASVEYRPELARRSILVLLKNADGPAGLADLTQDAFEVLDPQVRLTASEIREAADDLVTGGYIKGQRRADGDLYIADITPEGRRALRGPAPIGGDTLVSTPLQYHYSTNSTTITGNNNQVAAGTAGAVHQTSSIDNSAVTAGYESVAQLVQVLIESLPRLQLDPADDAEVRETLDIVTAEVVKEAPDTSLIKRALNAARGLLAPVMLGMNAAVTAESTEVARSLVQQISDLTLH